MLVRVWVRVRVVLVLVLTDRVVRERGTPPMAFVVWGRQQRPGGRGVRVVAILHGSHTAGRRNVAAVQTMGGA